MRIVKGTRRDVLLWTEDEAEAHVCGVLNAGDCYCIPGNEFGYCSVEAMIGNNTDLRVVQSYIHNPYLLDACRHVPVSVARASAWVAEGLRLPARVAPAESADPPAESGAGASAAVGESTGATATAAGAAAREAEAQLDRRMASASELAHAAAAAHAARQASMSDAVATEPP